MSRERQGDIKDVGGFVGGFLRDGVRRKGHVERRSVLTLDLDFAPSAEEVAAAVRREFGCAFLIYSTHKHTESEPRLRLVIPFDRPLDAEMYQAAGRKVADCVGIDWFDDTTYEAERLMYWYLHPRAHRSSSCRRTRRRYAPKTC